MKDKFLQIELLTYKPISYLSVTSAKKLKTTLKHKNISTETKLKEQVGCKVTTLKTHNQT